MEERRWIVAVLFAAAAVVFLVGNGRTSLFDRDEPRYAQCSRQMKQSGDWVVPRLYDKIRAAKPPGIYWCQATAMEIFGENAFAARFPSVVATLATMALLGVSVAREAGWRRGMWTLFVFSTTTLVIYASKMAMTDAVLLLWTFIAFVCIYLLWQRRGGWGAVIALSVAIAFGGLIKGPFILGVLAATLAVLGLVWAIDRRWPPAGGQSHPDQRGGRGSRRAMSFEPALARQEPRPPFCVESGSDDSARQEPRPPFGAEAGSKDVARQEPRPPFCVESGSEDSARQEPRPPEADPLRAGDTNSGNAELRPISALRVAMKSLVGLAIVAALVVPWVVMVQHREPIFLSAATADAREHLEKGSEGHTGYPGFHLLVIWGTYLPWSLLLPLAIGMGIAHRREPLVRFALASVFGSWIFAEVLKTKLPHYMLPAMPGLAFLTADAIVHCLDGQSDALTSRGIRIGAGVIAIVILALATVPWWWLAIAFHSFPWAALIALAIIGLVYAACVWFFFHARRPFAGLISMGVGAMALGLTLFGLYFPHSEPLRLSIRAADILKAHDVTHPGQVQMLDYKEPSLAFYQGGTIREPKHSLPVVEHIDTAPPWMVMTREIWNAAPPEARARMEIIGKPLRGFNYSDSLRPTELLVVKKR